MTTKRRMSNLGRAGVAVAVLVVGYLGWRVFDLPVNPDGAELAAVRATSVLMRTGSGDAHACAAMEPLYTSDIREGIVKRCEEVVSEAASRGFGPMGVRDLAATDVDVGRYFGTVTVQGTMLTQGPSFALTVKWPVNREDDEWRVSGPPEVDVAWS